MGAHPYCDTNPLLTRSLEPVAPIAHLSDSPHPCRTPTLCKEQKTAGDPFLPPPPPVVVNHPWASRRVQFDTSRSPGPNSFSFVLLAFFIPPSHKATRIYTLLYKQFVIFARILILADCDRGQPWKLRNRVELHTPPQGHLRPPIRLEQQRLQFIENNPSLVEEEPIEERGHWRILAITIFVRLR